jgi:hypothetical protein
LRRAVDIVQGVPSLQVGEVTTPAVSGRAARLRTYRVLAPFFVLLLLWLWLFRSEGAFEGGPNGKAFEGDFAMFITAAQILKEGGNPYDHNLLFRREKAFLDRLGLPITQDRPVVRVGNPPLLFWAMEPLTRFGFQAAALAWLVLMYALSLAGFLGALAYLGWRRRLIPCFLFALMPQVLFGPFYGNIVCLVFAGLGCALAVLRRYPFLAGALCSVALIKPPVALPIVLLLLLFHPAQRARMLAGFIVALAALCAVTVLVLGLHVFELWAAALAGYSRDIQQSPDIASLSGLYVRSTGMVTRSTVQLATLGMAAAITAGWWWRRRSADELPLLGFAWLSFVWFLAAPYAHFFDEVLLTVPLLILFGRDGHRVAWRWSHRVLYLMLFSMNPFKVQLLALPLIAVTACLLIAGLDPRYRAA